MRARAAVIGRVRDDARYRILKSGQTGLRRPGRGHHGRDRAPPGPAAPRRPARGGASPPVRDHEALFRRLIGSPNLGSREPIWRYYDTEVQGRMVIRAGRPTPPVMAPLAGSPLGCALSVGGNPWYVAADPVLGLGALGVPKRSGTWSASARGPQPSPTASISETPRTRKSSTSSFGRSAGSGTRRALSARRALEGPPIPFVSGNVSFYNESSTGRADRALSRSSRGSVSSTTTRWRQPRAIKRAGSVIVLTGPRESRLGASQLRHALTGRPAAISRRSISIASGGASTPCSRRFGEDSSSRVTTSLEGGLAVAALEMALGGFASQGLGLQIPISGLGESAPEVRLYWNPRVPPRGFQRAAHAAPRPSSGRRRSTRR